MRFHDYEVSANLSLLFPELPYLERFDAAGRAGFTLVESWWPFATPTPTDADLDALVAAIDAAGVTLTGLNFWAGDMPSGERGVACLPEREGELRVNVPVVVDIARRTGCRFFNLLYGCIDPDAAAAGHAHATRMVTAAADAVREIGGTVLIEPLAAALNGTYPLHTVDDVFKVIDRVDASNVRLLFDLFHLASNGTDLPATASRVTDRIGHIQFADAPGRGEPGTGDIPIRETFAALRAAGYTGSVAAEYKPTSETANTLGWADR